MGMVKGTLRGTHGRGPRNLGSLREAQGVFVQSL